MDKNRRSIGILQVKVDVCNIFVPQNLCMVYLSLNSHKCEGFKVKGLVNGLLKCQIPNVLPPKSKRSPKENT